MHDDITRLQNENEELRNELRREQAEKVQQKKTYETIIRQSQVQAGINELTATYKTIFDELPAKARIAGLRSLIDKMLQEKNAILVPDNNGQLVLHTVDGSNVFGPDNRPWNPAKLIETSLSQNNVMLSASTDAPTERPEGPADQKSNPDGKRITILSHLVNSSLKDLESSSQ